MSSEPPEPIPGGESGSPERFDDLLARLRGLVERLEGGRISLEEGLRCFEEGMALCKKGGEILDRAEHRVEVLLGTGPEGPRVSPFEVTPNQRED